MLSGIDATMFTKDGHDWTSSSSNGDYAAINAIKTTIAGKMGLAVSSVNIDSITTAHDPTSTPTGSPTKFKFRERRGLLEVESGSGEHPAGVSSLLGGIDESIFTSAGVGHGGSIDLGLPNNSQSRRRLDPLSCTIAYSVTFYAQDLGYSDTVAAYVSITNSLQKSLVSGSFATALVAVAKMYGASNLASATFIVQCQTNDPNNCSLIGDPKYVYLTPAPTKSPTTKPTGAFSQEALHEGWSPLRFSLVVGLSGAGLLIFAFGLYYFRHHLPGKGYKRRDAAFKELEEKTRKQQGKNPSTMQTGAECVARPNILTLDDLMGDDVDEGADSRGARRGRSGHGGSDFGGSALSDLSEHSFASLSRHSGHSEGFMPHGSGRKARLNPAAAAPGGGSRGASRGDFDFQHQGQLTRTQPSGRR